MIGMGWNVVDTVLLIGFVFSPYAFYKTYKELRQAFHKGWRHD